MACVLDGITVLDLSTGPAAALATMFLSDQGARVIRVVDPAQSHTRDGGYVVWDRGKECVALDLDDAAAQIGGNPIPAPDTAAALFQQLVAGADVLVDDFAPSADRQRLVQPKWLSRVNARLVHCSITAYGKQGPLKDEPPIDDLVLARLGVLGGMPGFRPAPVHVVHPLPSAGAAILADIGIAAALLAREKTGRGRAVETTLMAGALLYHPKVTGDHLKRHVFQTHPSGSAPFYSVYECADGKWVQLGCVHTRFIAIAAGLMGIGDLVAEPRFDGGRPAGAEEDAELRDVLTGILRTKPYGEWAEAFEAADVPFAPSRLTEDGMADSQVIHNGMVVSLEDPEVGPVLQMGVPIHFSETPGQVKGPRSGTARLGLPDGYPAALETSPSGPDAPDPLPLSGIRILEITNLIAGPTGGRLLADLGADVIKLEPHAGDLSRPIGRTYFYNINFDKRSVCVDTGTDAGKEMVQRIAASADALLANLRPHATERMGIGAAINPRLIETHLTGYGWTGPYAHRPGIDPLAQALMGLERAQGGPDNPPVFPAQLAPTDFTTGAMGTLGTILAIYARRRTGVVQRVDCNLLNGAVVLSSAWFAQYSGKPVRPLADKAQYGLGPFHRLYQVRDGWIYVVAESEDARRALCAAAGFGDANLDAAVPEAGQHPNDTQFARSLAEFFKGRGLEETLAALNMAGVPCAPAQAGDSELFLEDPHALANGMVATRQHPSAGTLSVAWRYVQFGNTAPAPGRPTPLLGEHNDEVLRDVGYDEDAIHRLHADGVIKTETV
ncbi:MAG: CoA transferase [Alphaproteobacteria bacterium]|nr:CoA transferase [Alphaproteobacteria bacterium]